MPLVRSQPGPIVLPESREELAFLPVTALSELIRTRQISSLELTRLYLDRLQRFDSILHAVVTLTEDRALRKAAEMDAELARGLYRGPLHGIPWGAKDLLAVRGYPTTWGAGPIPRADHRRRRDGGPAAGRGGGGAGGEAHPRRARDGRCLVRWDDPQPLESRAGLERLVCGLGRGCSCRPSRLRDRHGNAGLDLLPLHAGGGHGAAPNLWPSPPHGCDGALVEHGQDRPDLPERGRLRAGAGRDSGS